MAAVEVRMSGRLVRNAELRFTNGGKAVCEFVLVVNHRYQQGGSWQTEDDGLFMDVVCWDKLAEHCAQSLEKGDTAIVYGRLKPESWTNNEGVKVNRTKLIADDVGVSLRWSPVEIQRSERTRVSKPNYDETEAL